MVSDDCKLSCLLAHLIQSQFSLYYRKAKKLTFKLFLKELLTVQCSIECLVEFFVPFSAESSALK